MRSSRRTEKMKASANRKEKKQNDSGSILAILPSLRMGAGFHMQISVGGRIMICRVCADCAVCRNGFCLLPESARLHRIRCPFSTGHLRPWPGANRCTVSFSTGRFGAVGSQCRCTVSFSTGVLKPTLGRPARSRCRRFPLAVAA